MQQAMNACIWRRGVSNPRPRYAVFALCRAQTFYVRHVAPLILAVRAGHVVPAQAAQLDERHAICLGVSMPLHIQALSANRTLVFACTIKTVWPSGLRRWLQAPVRKGVGSNPTAVIHDLDLWMKCDATKYGWMCKRSCACLLLCTFIGFCHVALQCSAGSECNLSSSSGMTGGSLQFGRGRRLLAFAPAKSFKWSCRVRGACISEGALVNGQPRVLGARRL